MNNLISKLVWRSFHVRRVGVAALVVALPLVLAFTSGCYCPEPHHAEAVVDSPVHAEAAKQLIAAAEAKKVWTEKDEDSLRANLAHLSPETRLATAKRVAGLINSKAIHIERKPTKADPPSACPCMGERCGGGDGMRCECGHQGHGDGHGEGHGDGHDGHSPRDGHGDHGDHTSPPAKAN